MFNNDERYWDINKLNKWFAISSILFMVSMVWTFVDDNDDEFKVYQRQFRKLEIQITEKNLEKELEVVKADRVSYGKDLDVAQSKLDVQKEKLAELEKEKLAELEKVLNSLKGRYYNDNMIYQGQKAEVDGLKFLVEAENANHGNEDHHGPSHKDEYSTALDLLQEYKLNKEATEIEIDDIEGTIKSMKTEVKLLSDKLNIVLKNVNIVDNKLKKLTGTE